MFQHSLHVLYQKIQRHNTRTGHGPHRTTRLAPRETPPDPEPLWKTPRDFWHRVCYVSPLLTSPDIRYIPGFNPLTQTDSASAPTAAQPARPSSAPRKQNKHTAPNDKRRMRATQRGTRKRISGSPGCSLRRGVGRRFVR